MQGHGEPYVSICKEIFRNEYGSKRIVDDTDPAGKKDLPGSPFTRIYFMSSMQHGPEWGIKGACQQFQILSIRSGARALFVALDKWAAPECCHPRARFRSFRMVPW